MYEENILSVTLDGITIITRATCGSANFFSFFNVETRDRDIAIHHRESAIGFANLSRANLHASLGNRCSDMFAFPHFLRKLSVSVFWYLAVYVSTLVGVKNLGTSWWRKKESLTYMMFITQATYGSTSLGFGSGLCFFVRVEDWQLLHHPDRLCETEIMRRIFVIFLVGFPRVVVRSVLPWSCSLKYT